MIFKSFKSKCPLGIFGDTRYVKHWCTSCLLPDQKLLLLGVHVRYCYQLALSLTKGYNHSLNDHYPKGVSIHIGNCHLNTWMLICIQTDVWDSLIAVKYLLAFLRVNAYRWACISEDWHLRLWSFVG